MEPGHRDGVVKSDVEAAATGTWAQGGAGCFLDILPLTEGTPVERRRVGAAPAPFLPAAPTGGTADGPLGPRRPPTVHWPDREGLGQGAGASSDMPAQEPGRERPGAAAVQEGSPGGEATLCPGPPELGSTRSTARLPAGVWGNRPNCSSWDPRLRPQLFTPMTPAPPPLSAPGDTQGPVAFPRLLLSPHLPLPTSKPRDHLTTDDPQPMSHFPDTPLSS